MPDVDPIPTEFSANDAVVAHLVIYSSSLTTLQFTDALDTIEGRAWLKRRLEAAHQNVGVVSARQTEDPEVVEV